MGYPLDFICKCRSAEIIRFSTRYFDYSYTLVWIFNSGHTFVEFQARWYEAGLNMVDFVAVIVLIWAHIIITFVFLFIFRNSAKPISILCQTMAEHNTLLGIQEKDLGPVTKRTYFALLTLMALHVLSVLTSYRYCNDLLAQQFNEYLTFPTHIIWISIVSIFFWPFPAAASFIVNRQCLLILLYQLQTYKSKLEAKDAKTEEIDKNEDTKIEIIKDTHESLIELGFKLRSSLDTTSRTLGSFLFVDICMCVFVTIITIYFTPLIFESISMNENSEIIVNKVKLSYGLHCLFLAIKASVRWINFYRVGQKIASKCQKISQSLEQALMDQQGKILKETKRSMKILIRRFQVDALIRPWDSFDLNLSTAVSAAGLVATYLVILIQFRQSNVESTHLANNTSV